MVWVLLVSEGSGGQAFRQEPCERDDSLLMPNSATSCAEVLSPSILKEESLYRLQ
jgi:hypothetical protein